ncbi:acyl-CoA carboxylase epsilon subunit [Corynebacterium caspium]|uniref:acyl-CoA carboxylase epsilon subunit n=1 Tax=Corynebacterium caspium TaxID=234828 RepID=UPI0003610A1F|nr:acyl-CoA carboxylase epsilon subunit [Corynebacterium caspium]WKD59737.1 hypothetical protein CCASP_06790 [Corynebacterium caspium DSM 44850]
MVPIFSITKGTPDSQELAALTMLMAAGNSEQLTTSKHPRTAWVPTPEVGGGLKRTGLPGFNWH